MPRNTIQIKRIYEPPSPEDGVRILVERLWPRGLSKDKATVDYWMKDIAPSHELRKWYHHGEGSWQAFRQRYWDELRSHPEGLEELRKILAENQVTFVYAARDPQQNSGVALKEFIENNK